jgi:4-hydroxy-tetrahydrodipicolinate synthase
MVGNLPGGVAAPLATPLTEMETLDMLALRKLVQHPLQEGVDALFVLGSCGEGPLLTDETRLQVIRYTPASRGGLKAYTGSP